MHPLLLAKMESSEEVSGSVDIAHCGVHPFPFDIRGGFLRLCGREGLLDLESEECVVSLSLIWAAPLLLAVIFVLEYLSTGDKLQLLSLGPISLLPQVQGKTNLVK